MFLDQIITINSSKCFLMVKIIFFFFYCVSIKKMLEFVFPDGRSLGGYYD